VLKRDIKTGAATLLESHGLLQADSKLKAWAADIHLTPDGQFLYASERTGSSLTGFKINKPDGRLTSIGHWDTEQQPRAFAISPDGRFLAAVGQKSNSMTLYNIHPDTGELTQLERQVTGINPGWVEMVSLQSLRD
jgi:6-phosphogluconolactonase